MGIDKQKALLYCSAAALRFALFTAFPLLPDFLAGRAEISTPVTSFKRCTSFVTNHFQRGSINMDTRPQYKKASSSTPTMSLLTMAAFSIR